MFVACLIIRKNIFFLSEGTCVQTKQINPSKYIYFNVKNYLQIFASIGTDIETICKYDLEYK